MQEADTQEAFLLHPDNRPVIEEGAPYKDPKSAQSPGLCLGMLFLPLGLVYVLAFLLPDWIANVSEWWGFNQVSVATTATVLERWEEERYSRSAPGRERTIYYIRYEYYHTPIDGDPRRYEVASIVNRSAYAQAAPGTRISVVYDPADPTRIMLDTSTTPLLVETGLLLALVLFFVGIPLALLLSGIAIVRRGRRLNVPGAQILPGQVCWSMGHWSGKPPYRSYTVTLRYAFRSPTSGQTLAKQASAERDDMGDQPLPPEGTPVYVLYQNDKLFELL